jgi:ABC-2 type transport system permease protein
MQAIVIALKDLQVLFKDRGALLLMFLLPLVFIVVFSGALAAIGDVEPEDSRIVLAVVDLDRSEAAQNLMDDLEAAGGIRVEFYDEQDAATLLDEGELARVLTIPSDYSARLEDGRQVTLRLINHADTDAQKTEAVWRIIDGVARDIHLKARFSPACSRWARCRPMYRRERRSSPLNARWHKPGVSLKARKSSR